MGRTPNTNITNIYKFININKTKTYVILHWGEKCPLCFKCSNLATMGLNLQPFGFVPPSRQTRSQMKQLTVSTHSFSTSTEVNTLAGPETLCREFLPERARNGGWKSFFGFFKNSWFPVNSKCIKCLAPEIF